MAKPRIKFNRPADLPPSAARAELAAANAEFTAVAQRQSVVAFELNEANQAADEAIRLHGEFQAWLSEAALMGDLDDGERKRRAALVLDARARAVNTGELDAEFRRLNQEASDLQHRRHATIMAIVREEMPGLSRTYHRLAQTALKAEAALIGLKEWALSQGESALAVDLIGATRLDPDMAKAALLIGPWKAEVERYGVQWRNLPARLMSDPNATVEAVTCRAMGDDQ